MVVNRGVSFCVSALVSHVRWAPIASICCLNSAVFCFFVFLFVLSFLHPNYCFSDRFNLSFITKTFFSKVGSNGSRSPYPGGPITGSPFRSPIPTVRAFRSMVKRLRPFLRSPIHKQLRLLSLLNRYFGTKRNVTALRDGEQLQYI